MKTQKFRWWYRTPLVHTVTGADTAALSAPQTGYQFWSHTDSQSSGFRHRSAATLLVSNTTFFLFVYTKISDFTSQS